LISDIPAGDGNIEKLFYGVYSRSLCDLYFVSIGPYMVPIFS
jgi:hypothetical protein